MVCYITIQYYNLIFNNQFSCMPLALPFWVVGVQTQTQTEISNCHRSAELEGKINQMPKQQQIREKPTTTHIELPTSRESAENYQEEGKLIIQPKTTQKRHRQLDSFTERRNIIPNNINHVLAFVQRKSKSQHVVQRIIQKYQKPALTANRYYCYQTFLKQKLQIHVNRYTLQTISSHLQLNEDIFSVEEQLFYNRITRILISYYIRQMAKLKILSSGRVKCTNKIDHLKAHRLLLQFLVGHYEEP